MTNAMLFICWELLPMLTESSSSFDNHKGQTSHFFYPRFWHSLWLTKVHLVKALLFPVVNVCMWELDHNESWAPKNWCFWTVVVEKTLEIWTARISNQSILKEISLEYSLEGPMLKLKLQFFGHLIRRTDSLEKTLMLGRTGGRRRRGWQRMRWLDSITDTWTWVWVSSRSWWWIGKPGVLQSMGSQRVRHDWET